MCLILIPLWTTILNIALSFSTGTSLCFPKTQVLGQFRLLFFLCLFVYQIGSCFHSSIDQFFKYCLVIYHPLLAVLAIGDISQTKTISNLQAYSKIGKVAKVPLSDWCKVITVEHRIHFPSDCLNLTTLTLNNNLTMLLQQKKVHWSRRHGDSIDIVLEVISQLFYHNKSM